MQRLNSSAETNSTRTNGQDLKKRSGSFRKWVCWLMLLCAIPSLTGCQYIILMGYLIGGPPSIEPDFDRETKKSFTGKKQKVAVVCYAPDKVKWDFDKIDRELSFYVTHRLKNHKIIVIDPDQVNAWVEANPDWDKPDELGEAAGADYVVYIELDEFSLYEENSSNLYRGRTKGMVSVYEMENGEGEVIYEKDLDSKYPIHSPVATSEKSFYDFKTLYMSRLSEEIGRLFYEHFAGDDIPEGMLNE